MSRSSIIGFLILFSTSFAQVRGEPQGNKSRTIPLDTIWANGMTGTKNVRELELEKHDPPSKYLQTMTHQIVRYLAVYGPREEETAGPGFVVVGSGKTALSNALIEFTEKKPGKRDRPFPKKWELSLVFYAYAVGWHPQIKSVEQSPESITVKYQFIAPEEPSSAALPFALIPIGKLPAGTVDVKIEEIPPINFKGRSLASRPDMSSRVCTPFSFTVR